MANALDKFRERRDDLKVWCKQDIRAADHKHLDEGTSERLYWHMGYASALADVLTFLGDGKTQN